MTEIAPKFILNISKITKEFTHHVVWSLQPIIRSLGIFGLDVGLPRSSSKLKNSKLNILCLASKMLILIYMTSSNIYIRTYEILDVHTDDHGKSTVFYLFLNSSSCLILETLFVLAMVQMSFFKWTEIWNKMRTMERFIQSPGSSHRKNRRHSIILIVIGFALVNFISVNTMNRFVILYLTAHS